MFCESSKQVPAENTGRKKISGRTRHEKKVLIGRYRIKSASDTAVFNTITREQNDTPNARTPHGFISVPILKDGHLPGIIINDALLPLKANTRGEKFISGHRSLSLF